MKDSDGEPISLFFISNQNDSKITEFNNNHANNHIIDNNDNTNQN